MSSRLRAEPRYGLVAIALHWLLAVLILSVFAAGLSVADMPFSLAKLKLINWHKWGGMTILALSAVRLFWRWTHRPPALPARIASAMPAWQRMAFHGTHHLMYLLFLAVPLLGWAYSSAKGYPIVWFGVLPLPDWVAPNEALANVLKPLHALGAYGLIGLVALHVGAALKHQLIDRDGLISRMLPGR